MALALLTVPVASAADAPATTTHANAVRAHSTGMSLKRKGGADGLEAAVPWLEKATTLEPGNSDYLGDYGGVCLELADKKRSYLWAVRGRDALEKTVELNPDDLDARDGLMEFYARAPWPLGSVDKAVAEAAEIARRNPLLGSDTEYRLGTFLEKKGDLKEALAAYREALRLDPNNRKAQDGITRTQ